MKFGTFAAALAVSLAVGLPAGAQDKAPNGAAPADPVVATVNGAKIFRSDVEAARGQLPEQYRNLPMDQLFTPLVNQLVRSKLMAGKARADNLPLILVKSLGDAFIYPRADLADVEAFLHAQMRKPLEMETS